MNLSNAFSALLMTATAHHLMGAEIKPSGSIPEEIDHEIPIADDESPQSIVGGTPIIPNSRPYLLSIGNKRHFCGASLISSRAVMTAAHCLFYPTDSDWAPPFWVDFHRHNLTDDDGVVRLYLNDTNQCDGDVVYHPQYNIESFSDRDVAVLFLPRAMNDITPVILNEDARVPIAGAQLDVAGWGVLNYSDTYFPQVAQEVTTTYITNEACTRKPYSWPDADITDAMLCNIAPGKSSCSGDSGGPVVLANQKEAKQPVVQVGIVSWGFVRCIHPRLPSVDTRVSAVAAWVKATVCERTGELCPKSKTSKIPKGQKLDICIKRTQSPTISDTPSIRDRPSPSPATTPIPSTAWPTWTPTESPAPSSKAGKGGK